MKHLLPGEPGNVRYRWRFASQKGENKYLSELLERRWMMQGTVIDNLKNDYRRGCKEHMRTLFDVIRFEGKRHSQLTDLKEQKRVEEVFEKLRPLETEILKHQHASIAIVESGNIIMSLMPVKLHRRIREMLAAG